MSRFSLSLKPAAGAVALAFALSGCQLLGIGAHGRTAFRDDSAAILADFGADQLAQGRTALVEGRTADAIEAFIIAKAFPEQTPAAFNGLAVAYSRLGRNDLAERFFQSAVALAPQEDRYRSNLSLFYSRNGLPRTPAPMMAVAAPAPEAGTPIVEAPGSIAVATPPSPFLRSLGAGVTVQAPQARLQRVSAAEVRINSPTTPRVTRQPVIHVGRAEQVTYPVRITLSDIKVEPAPGRTD